jgi:hypothetical protein
MIFSADSNSRKDCKNRLSGFAVKDRKLDFITLVLFLNCCNILIAENYKT